ncbi:helix-turn-helix transcriptional regulator [Bacteroides sp. 519]|uniref:helix-turn-helix domain-containing protein n=1 Tax=Bacteroides sp. 519 TaxID=2302937 RepID=UPI0013D01F2A|nr:helix-turn-helix transcriptional regulator [Bacteroides sp. 519]NDV58055.1 XRE family transcriptional regulator [Bacteroides sp. 519]
MDTNVVNIRVTKTENGYCAGCDLLSGWVVAVTGNFLELEKEVRDSIDFYVECAKIDNEEYPHIFDGEYELHYIFNIESLLNYYGKIFTKAALEHITGINQKQLSHYACGRSVPRKETADKIIKALHALGQELMVVSV